MKAFLLILSLIFSSWAISGELPKEESPCNWGSTCINFDGLNTVFSRGAIVLNTMGLTNKLYPGIYYQRATGSNCGEAVREAKEKMLFNHPEFRCDGNYDNIRDDINCGAINHGPELIGGTCTRSSKGETVAWIKCDNSYTPGRPQSHMAKRDAFMYVRWLTNKDKLDREAANRSKWK
jgi:hypothetical protein